MDCRNPGRVVIVSDRSTWVKRAACVLGKRPAVDSLVLLEPGWEEPAPRLQPEIGSRLSRRCAGSSARHFDQRAAARRLEPRCAAYPDLEPSRGFGGRRKRGQGL